MKALVGTEFLIVISFTVLLFALCSFLYYQRLSDLRFGREFIKANGQCLQISSTISEVMSSGNGFTQILEIPEKLENKNFSIEISGSSRLVRVKWNNEATSCSLQTSLVTNGTSSDFELEKGNVTFKNLESVVVID
ncbi:MAG: hypothetical protein QMD12_01615 [Candidatus Aenigmarchaeota archaeon]|nr:hypothetical protein [Candidatus Aenigmarchaeota archaeon]